MDLRDIPKIVLTIYFVAMRVLTKALMSRFPKHVLCVFPLILASVLAKAAVPENRISIKATAGFGGRIGVIYERRLTEIFALETGVEYGENFLNLRLSRLHHIGPYIGANFYVSEPANNHQFYFSPHLDLAYGVGKHSPEHGQDWKEIKVIALGASVFAGYRYQFDFNGTLEAGVGVDAVSLQFPLDRRNSVAINSLPLPKFQFGFGYRF